jgi:hypothetical protein
MNSGWRSWFWNIVLATCLFLMAAVIIQIVVDRVQAGGAAIGVGVGFGLVAAWLLTGAVRALMLGVFTRPEGMVVRGLGRTTKIRWDEVQSVGNAPLTSGAASLGNATAPAVIWERVGDRKPRRTELSVLGGYGIIGKGPTLAERATADLNARLSQWRDEKVTAAEG